MSSTRMISLKDHPVPPTLIHGTEEALDSLQRACNHYRLAPDTSATLSGDEVVEQSVQCLRRINCFPPHEDLEVLNYPSEPLNEPAQTTISAPFLNDEINIDMLLAGLDAANDLFHHRIFQLGILTYTTTEEGYSQQAELFWTMRNKKATNTLWLARFIFIGSDPALYSESFSPFTFRPNHSTPRPEHARFFTYTADKDIAAYCKYAHLTSAEILDGAAHPDEIFGQLLLRVAKHYTNAQLSDMINELRVKEKMKPRTPNMITKLISQAAKWDAVRNGVTYKDARLEFDGKREELGTKDVRLGNSGVKRKVEEEEDEDYVEDGEDDEDDVKGEVLEDWDSEMPTAGASKEDGFSGDYSELDGDVKMESDGE